MRLHAGHTVWPAIARPRPTWWPAIALTIGVVGHLVAKWPIVWHDQGVYWPDEIFESIEIAHNRVFGYGLLPWEYVVGARHWTFPLLLTLPVHAGVALGGGTPLAYLVAIRLSLVGLTLVTAWWIVRGAREHGASALASALAATSFLLCGTTLYFSHRALSENAAQLPVLVAVVLFSRRSRDTRDLVLGASALGIATLLRLQLALLCGLVAVVEVARAIASPSRRSEAAWVLATFAAWALVFGAIDAWAYGGLSTTRWYGWFHSARVYLAFNTQGGADFWGTAPPYYYGLVALRALEGLAVVLAVGVCLAFRRVPLLVSALVVFVAAHSAVPHKELRFILPVAPLAWTAAAIGLSRLTLPRFFSRRRAALASPRRLHQAALVALAATTALSLAGHRGLTMRDIGAYPERRRDPAFDDFGSVNRLLLQLHAHTELCGLAIDAPLSWTGGLSYLHRPVPMYGTGMPVPPGAVNFAIRRPDSAAGQVPPGVALAADGDYVLARLHNQPCTIDPAYDWRLH